VSATLPRSFLGLPAPAKINLFLHVVGRRPDGYHELQSVFVPIDLCDTIDVCAAEGGRIERLGELTGPVERDLAVRAAQLLQQRAQAGGWRPGARITVEKAIPVGAGLGGGSSDAATTLIALNRLWGLDLPRSELAALGLQLGADVPFFLGPGPAFVEGIGEQATPLPLPPAWVVLVFPQVAVSTAEIFADPKLTRSTKKTTIAGFSAALSALDRAPDPGPDVRSRAWGFGANDLEPVVRGRVAPVDAALRLLGQHAPARMSGSGSAVFAVFAQEAEAQQVAARLRMQAPPGWSVWSVAMLGELPLAPW